MKYTVSRMDIVSRKTYPLDRLFRLVKTDSGLVYDKDMSMPGRGIYLLKEEEAILLCKKRKLLLRYENREDHLNALFEELFANV